MSTTIHTLCDKLRVEHPDAPIDDIVAALNTDACLDELRKESSSYITNLKLSSCGNLNSIGKWLGSESDDNRERTVAKMRITASTATLLAKMPDSLRTHVDRVISAMPTSLTASKNADVSQRNAATLNNAGASTTNEPGSAAPRGGIDAMKFVSQMMNSDMIQTIADMANADDESSTELAMDVDAMQLQMTHMKSLVGAMQKEMHQMRMRLKLLEADGGKRRK